MMSESDFTVNKCIFYLTWLQSCECSILLSLLMAMGAVQLLIRGVFPPQTWHINHLYFLDWLMFSLFLLHYINQTVLLLLQAFWFRKELY